MGVDPRRADALRHKSLITFLFTLPLMNQLFRVVLILSAFVLPLISSGAGEPLRIFIRSGPKTHGPGAHDHPRFLRE